MTFNQLRTLLAVVRNNSISKAASELYVSQAAVSSALTSLAQEVGVALIEKQGRGIRVTQAGRVLFDYAVQIVGLEQEAKVATLARARPWESELRLAAVTTAGEALVPGWLRSFLKRYSQLQISLEVANKERVFDALISHEVDLAVAGSPPVGFGLMTRAARPHSLVLVGSPSEFDYGEDRIVHCDLQFLAAQTWLLREPGSGTRSSVEELLVDLGIAPRLLAMGSNGSLREAARLGLGVALLSTDAVTRELEQGSLVELRYGPLPLVKYWHLVTRESELIPGPALSFVEHLLQQGEVKVTP